MSLTKWFVIPFDVSSSGKSCPLSMSGRRLKSFPASCTGRRVTRAPSEQLFTGGDLGVQFPLVTTAQMLGEADAEDLGGSHEGDLFAKIAASEELNRSSSTGLV